MKGETSAGQGASRYIQIIERVFLQRFTPGATEVPFERDDIVRVANELGIRLPKNLGDVIYSFRYRAELPESIRERAPQGKDWIIRPMGQARYAFTASHLSAIRPTPLLAETKLPDATPGIIAKYALNDEQALLAKVRYNRLIDIFSGVACYSLQSHLRTNIAGIGQVETDEIYVGVDHRGAHFVFPVQAKSGRDTIGIVQIEQDFALCEAKFPGLICRPIAAQFMDTDLIAIFAFEQSENGVALAAEKHYRLVTPDEVTRHDLHAYRLR